MILVDVYVPSLNRVYDFNLDEDSAISVLISEISELICKKEHSVLDGLEKEFIMGSIDGNMNFNPVHSLKEYGIKNGDKLILA